MQEKFRFHLRSRGPSSKFSQALKQSSRLTTIKVARYSFSRSIPPEFERKLRRNKQGFGKIDTTVVLNKEENWL